ncbi:MAG: AmmeMemoRadiSam system radical SAM enzyme [Planctomycetaceae bacterium]|nr:AmmeMemoRadiSam system radical SAM enzyme [Planctomycetaceae bacterium]
MLCDLCPRHCSIGPNQTGFCFVRQNQDNKLVLATYGKNSGLAVDPIEKKPLYHFLPGSKTLSFGTIGCNLGCTFCQNWTTSKSRDIRQLQVEASPEQIAALAVQHDCRSVALTYNEPIVWAEYAVDTAVECRKQGVKTVCVSAGYISPQKRKWFFESIDATNIDLKAFSDRFYKEKCGASIEPVKETLRFLAKETETWLEITTLLIPGENDSDEELTAMCKWIRKELGAGIPLHFSAFRPAYKENEIAPTPPQTLFRAREIAHQNGLCYVYTGNIHDPAGQSTACPQCKQTVAFRARYTIGELAIDEDSCCKFCGQSIAGIWSF